MRPFQATVEDVTFNPNNSNVFASVGDDLLLLLWDSRQGTKPTHTVATEHTMDVNSVSWNPVHDHLLATGSSDKRVHLYDLRRLPNSNQKKGSGADNTVHQNVMRHNFTAHESTIIQVDWSPHGGHLISCADDGFLNVWDMARVPPKNPPLYTQERSAASSSGFEYSNGLGGDETRPRELMLRHAGHRGAVVGFAWNPHCPSGWTVASLSDESKAAGLSGGVLQVWRPNNLLYRPTRQVLKDVTRYMND